MPRSLKKRSAFLVSFHFFVPNICIFISVFLCYFIIYSIHFLKSIKICRTLYQHYLFYLTCMDIFKTCNLLSITDTRFDYRLLIVLIICLYYCFLLKKSQSDHLLLTLPSISFFQRTEQSVRHLLLYVFSDLLYDSCENLVWLSC